MEDQDTGIQTLPCATGMEKSILSSMMQDDAQYFLDRAVDLGLSAEMFYLPAHATLFSYLRELRKQGTPIELISLTQGLRERNLLENLGGVAELMGIQTYAPSSAHFDRHLGIVKIKSVQRVAIRAHTQAIAELYLAESGDVEATVSRSAQTLTKALEGFSPETGDFSAKELMMRFTDYVEGCIEGVNTETIPTPWPRLNDLLGGGIGLKEISFIAGRPSMGKTSLALDILTHAAKAGVPGQFISIESPEMKIANRMVAGQGGGTVNALSKGNITQGDLSKISKAVGRVADMPLRVRKMHGPNASQVASAVRKAVRDHGAKVVVIDYIQIIRASNASERSDVRLRMDNALDELCPLAAELDIALVILAQLSRDAEGEPGKDLDLSMLKETSRIEQDADLVLVIGGAHDHDSDGEDREPRVIGTPKNRDGPTSFARVQFHGPTTTFHSHFAG